MENVSFILYAIGPIFILILLGFGFKQFGIINDNFNKLISQFIFTVSLPALIFMKLAFVQFDDVFQLKTTLLILCITLVIFLISWVLAVIFIDRGAGRGVFIQGSFRSNEAILGMAIVMSIYGDQAAAKVATILVFLMPLFNVLSIVALTFSDNDIRKEELKKGLISIARNPLIIAIIVAIIVSVTGINIHSMIKSVANLLADIALPLALIGIGASLNFNHIKSTSLLAFSSSAIKLLLTPLLGTPIAYFIGIRGTDLGIVFIMLACPTAIVSYIMAESMGKHGKIASNIIVISTIASLVTLSIGLLFLKSTQLI
ncbi:AEC family transporter [Candidatus Neomarinimicrobiota bacterium]